MNEYVCPTLYTLCIRAEAAATTTEREETLSEVIDHVCYCEHDHPYCAAIEPHEPNRTASASDQRADLLDWAAEITEFALQP